MFYGRDEREYSVINFVKSGFADKRFALQVINLKNHRISRYSNDIVPITKLTTNFNENHRCVTTLDDCDSLAFK